jgi:signal transduction histidine kinase
VADRQRLERDLHDGVQNELVALIVKLALVQEDHETPPRLAHLLAELEARAQAALDSVRSIARGIDPTLLADFGLAKALRAGAARSDPRECHRGLPRSTEQAEEGVYFSYSEAIQNAAKHAGLNARMTLWLHHHDRSLRVLVTDDGRGFDPAHTSDGAGLQNIRGRVVGLGGSVQVASRPGLGTVLTISLPWPATGVSEP